MNASTNVRHLTSYLATRSVACPSCGQDLRGLGTGRCARCGEELALEVGLAEARVGALAGAAAGLLAGAGAGLMLLAVLGFIVRASQFRGDPRMAWFAALGTVLVVVGGGGAALLLRSRGRRWFRDLDAGGRRRVVMAGWALTGGAVAAFFFIAFGR